jgi:gluconate 2-dehydrogenase gamma chain
MSDQPSSRRQFLIGAAGAAAVIPILSHAAAPAAQPAAQPAPVPPGYESLGPAEAAFVEAMVNVMCPADALTPNGVDCGLATFIDRQLAGGFGKGERYYPQNSGYNPTGPLGALSLRLGDDLNRYITNPRML